MTRYIVIGAGAVGGTTAAELHRAGREVVLIARGRHLELLRERGLEYVTAAGTERVVLPVAGGPQDIALRAGDVLVLATKSQDTEATVAEWAWQPVKGTDASAAELLPIVLLQNGLDNVRPALRRFATVFDAAVLIPASYVTPGEVVSPAAPDIGAIFLGAAPHGTDPRIEQVATDLRAARYAVQVVPDIGRWKAGKLLGNLAHNLDALYQPSELRDAAAAALRAEASAVLAAAGIDVAQPFADGDLDLTRIATQPIAGHDRGGSSTWQSLARSGSHESDFLNGEIALLARLYGARAPLNAAVQARAARVARDGTAAGGLDDADLRRTLPTLAVLVDIKTLRDELAGANPPLLLDVRWALGDPRGRGHFDDGHIPGAAYVDLETELADPAEPLAGRHPLPSIDRLQEAARGWGLTRGRPVVVYDNVNGLSAARAWWLLRWAGVSDVRILDGAFGAWSEAGFDIESGSPERAAGDIELAAGHLPTLSADEAAELARDGVLLDARAAERYRGDIEPIDPHAGHIPAAISAPTVENLGPDGAFRTAEHLRARFAALGVTPGSTVGVYCGSGVTASHQIAALAIAGIDAALFPGSWSAWSSDPERPVATGPAPSATGPASL